MDPNIFDPNHPEIWYLLVEWMPDGKKVVRAAGSMNHCLNYCTSGNMAIIKYTSAEFWGV
jgi:hypothetical protein